MSGRRSRRKGVRTERSIVRTLQASGIAATKISRAYQPRYDIVLSFVGRDLCVEVKAWTDGFRELYKWLTARDVLVVRADRQEPLVVIRVPLAAEIAEAATATRHESSGCNVKGRAA